MTKATGIFQPNDPWPYHYRGSKYHIDAQRRLWWAMTDDVGEQRVYATGGHQPVAEEFLKIRPEGGSIRITELGAVITKSEEGPDWKPRYVCEMQTPLEFEHVDCSPEGLRARDLWPCFYDGARYSFSRRRLWWHNPATGLAHAVKEKLPAEVMGHLLDLKPEGGSFRITENGHVITLILPQPLPDRMKKQLTSMNALQQHLVQVKYESVARLPVYVGDYHEGFTLEPARKLTDPLSPQEQKTILAILKNYGQDIESDDEFVHTNDDRPERDP